jgi:16S rRNA (adenine1518-N6/adenine1519-N6)-dimethyltransferase
VEFVPKDAPQPPCDVSTLERVTAAAFGQRRKMLRSSLRQITPNAEELLQGLGIDRAEELQIGDFCRIANALGR